MEHALSVQPREDEDQLDELSDGEPEKEQEIANRPTVQLRDGRPQEDIDELQVSTEERADSGVVG